MYVPTFSSQSCKLALTFRSLVFMAGGVGGCFLLFPTWVTSFLSPSVSPTVLWCTESFLMCLGHSWGFVLFHSSIYPSPDSIPSRSFKIPKYLIRQIYLLLQSCLDSSCPFHKNFRIILLRITHKYTHILRIFKMKIAVSP